MFRKIHSNRPPGNTLGQELKREFGPYFQKLAKTLQGFLSRYRYAVFAGMVATMLVSGLLAFTIMRQGKPRPVVSIPRTALEAGPGITGAISAYQDLKQIAVLQDKIEAIARKKVLTDADSIQVRSALQQIDSLYHTIKHQSSP